MKRVVFRDTSGGILHNDDEDGKIAAIMSGRVTREEVPPTIEDVKRWIQEYSNDADLGEVIRLNFKN